MRKTSALLICVLGVFGCDESIEDKDLGTGPRSDLRCSSLPDLAPPPAKCAAAKGLSGDVLSGLCLDMDKLDKQGLVSRGFNLMAPPMNCAGWDVVGNKLQPTNINTSAGGVSCGLSLPNIPVDAKYSRVTLALIHQANLPNASQQARMELFDTITPLRVWVNPATALDQRTIVEIDRANIPGGPSAQVTLQLTAPMGSTVPVWTISSIAVLGQTAQ